MTDNVEVLGAPHRTYERERDWMDVPRPYNPTARNVIDFSPKLLQCAMCGRRTHRASQCPMRPRQGRPPAD